MRYELIAQAYRDLEQARGRLAQIDRLAALLEQTPVALLPTVAMLCQGRIAPDFAGVDMGMAGRLSARSIAEGARVPVEQVLDDARTTGDLGSAAERLLESTPRTGPADLDVATVFETLHQIAAAAGAGSVSRKTTLLTGLLDRATPVEACYLVRTVTGNLRVGIGTPSILDALAHVYTGSRKSRPVLERAYNICSDLGLVATTLANGGLDAVEQIRVRAGNPVRPMLAQRLSSTA
jgi:DNA ligase 1